MEYVVILWIVIIFWIIIWIFIAKKRKGQLKITVSWEKFSCGDTITWEIYLKAKKTIKWNKLTVTLACDQTTYSYDSDGNSKTRTKRIYEENKTITEAREYPAWTEQNHTFEFKIPHKEEKQAESVLGKALLKAAKIFGNKWKITRKIETRLDAKWLDITGSKKINIKN